MQSLPRQPSDLPTHHVHTYNAMIYRGVNMVPRCWVNAVGLLLQIWKHASLGLLFRVMTPANLVVFYFEYEYQRGVRTHVSQHGRQYR